MNPCLELGPGEYVQHPDWAVLDFVKYGGVNCIGNASKLPFKNKSFDRIEAKNLLEHFSFTKTVDILKEWGRTLRDKGALRLVIPLIHAAIKRYLKRDHQCEELNWGLMGGQRNKFDFHYVLFDKPYLKKCLREAGFSNIEVIKYYRDDFGTICGMEVEAVKV